MESKKINLKYQKQIVEIVLKNLKRDDVGIFLFGSYAQNKARITSDIDICIKCSEKVDFNLISKIRSELDDSNIPFEVDIVDYHGVSDEFKKIAFKEVVKWH